MSSASNILDTGDQCPVCSDPRVSRQLGKTSPPYPGYRNQPPLRADPCGLGKKAPYRRERSMDCRPSAGAHCRAGHRQRRGVFAGGGAGGGNWVGEVTPMALCRLFLLVNRSSRSNRFAHNKWRTGLFGELTRFLGSTHQGLWHFLQVGVFRVRDRCFHGHQLSSNKMGGASELSYSCQLSTSAL